MLVNDEQLVTTFKFADLNTVIEAVRHFADANNFAISIETTASGIFHDKCRFFGHEDGFMHVNHVTGFDALRAACVEGRWKLAVES
jgi:hypothetical protein